MTKVYTPKEYAAHLATAGKRLHPLLVKTCNRAAVNIQADWRDRARALNPPGSASASYPSTIIKRRGRVEGSTYLIEVETADRGQGLLGSILEYGGAHNAPQRSHIAAADAEAPNLAKWLAKLAAREV